MAKKSRVDLSEVVACFEELEDPRSPVNLRHPLPSVIVISLMAVLAGAEGPTAICQWAQLKKELLLSVLDLPHGVPKKDVFRRVLMTIDPQAFQVCFVEWINRLREASSTDEDSQRPVLAIDGKSLRRSHDKKNGLGPLHLVSVG